MVISPRFEEETPAGKEPVSFRFVNTVGSRLGSPDEYLRHPSALSEWLVGNGLVPGPVTISPEALAEALEFRELLFHVFAAIAEGEKPKAPDLGALNKAIERAVSHLFVNEALNWDVKGVSALDRGLMIIALSAAGLLTGPNRSRIRICANDTCGWVFLDHSKNRSRRWCDMSDCGNRAKAKRFQERKKLRA